MFGNPCCTPAIPAASKVSRKQSKRITVVLTGTCVRVLMEYGGGELMRRRTALMLWTLTLLALVFAGVSPAMAQGGSGSTTLSGVVSDAQGGVIPGAAVVVKNNATGATF